MNFAVVRYPNTVKKLAHHLVGNVLESKVGVQLAQVEIARVWQILSVQLADAIRQFRECADYHNTQEPCVFLFQCADPEKVRTSLAELNKQAHQIIDLFKEIEKANGRSKKS